MLKTTKKILQFIGKWIFYIIAFIPGFIYYIFVIINSRIYRYYFISAVTKTNIGETEYINIAFRTRGDKMPIFSINDYFKKQLNLKDCSVLNYKRISKNKYISMQDKTLKIGTYEEISKIESNIHAIRDIISSAIFILNHKSHLDELSKETKNHENK